MLDTSPEKTKVVTQKEKKRKEKSVRKKKKVETVVAKPVYEKKVVDEKREKENNLQKIVLFRLKKEFYAIDVSLIDEIIETEVKEKITGMPDFVIGVISLRGESIPVISLFSQFHLQERSLKESETILITSKSANTYGILIDELKGVLDIEPSFVFNVPSVYPEEELLYLKGMIKFEQEIAAIVDIKNILKKFSLD
jgi:purine-binding chemotaxis protein CheW